MQFRFIARRVLLGSALFGLTATSGVGVILPTSANANPAGDGLVINEAYLNGGSSGATYTNKFVELFNPTSDPIVLDGLSLQYRSPTGTANATGVVALTGTVAPGGYFLVQGGSNGANGAALPQVDQVSSINPGAGGGTLFVATGTAAANPTTITPVDLVGWGTSNAPEGGSAAPTASVTSSLQRDGAGADTDVNAADFAAETPTPRAINEPPVNEACDATSIAEVQGTGSTSPCVDDEVSVSGVVTAAYPTGGFNGFYLQTPGADTPDASDAIFVYTGAAGAASIPAVGASVQVSGVVSEFQGLTEISTSAASDITVLPESLGEVVAKTTIPGTDCALPGTDCLSGAGLEAAREASEGELFQPAGAYTVTDAYDGSAYNPPASGSGNNFGEIGMAGNSDIALVTPTEVVDASDTAGLDARIAYNNAHRVVLDDGSSTTYWNTAGTARTDIPMTWQTPDNYVRVGAGVTFNKPVVLDYRFGWKVQPTSPVTGAGREHVGFEQNRTDAPEPVGGDLKIATFNVLNYFTTTGEDWEALGYDCSSYDDREGNPIGVNRCPLDSSQPPGPRGAWNDASFTRQQTKIVNAITKIDADVMSLEELENSVKIDGGDRDEAIGNLVAALNAHAGTDRWAFVPSPPASELPPLEAQDVIRTGFIYNPATIDVVGASQVLLNSDAFKNARQPLAQAFKAKGAADADAFAVIVNHFKSKGDSNPPATGDNANGIQGAFNGDRTRQAQALTDFAAGFATARGLSATFLVGDFNAYTMEDPIQKLAENGFEPLESDTAGEWSYSFDGQSGSLDHVLANAAAKELLTGVDIWESNANESVFRQYSRYNYNAAALYSPDQFSASDHNPEVIGIKAPAPSTPPTPVEISVQAKRGKVRVKDTVTIKVKITPGENADGEVSAYLDGVLLDSATAVDGVASLTVGPFDTAGKKRIEIRYSGNEQTEPATTSLTLKVKKAQGKSKKGKPGKHSHPGKKPEPGKGKPGRRG